MKTIELKRKAKERNIKGRSKMKKAELLEVLELSPEPTKKELMALLKGRKIKGYYKMRKADLATALGESPDKSLKDLRNLAKERNNKTKGYSRMCKTELINGIDPKYKINKVGEKHNSKFSVWFDEYRVSDIKPGIDIDNIFTEIRYKVKKERGLVIGDKIRIVISHPTWQKPFSTKLQDITKRVGSIITNKITNFIEYKTT